MRAPSPADTRLPPGPALPRAVQGLCFARDPIGVLMRCRSSYGPIFTLRFPGAGSVVALAVPEAIDRVVDADPVGTHAGEARRAILPQASPRSSFGADGDAHLAARARIEPPLSRDRVEALGPAIAAIAGDHLDRWSTGRPFRLLARMRSLAAEVFVRLGLGVEDERRARTIAERLGRLLRTPGNPPLLPPDRDEGIAGAQLHRLFERRLAPLVELLSAEIEARRDHKGNGGILDHAIRSDPALSARQIIDELVVVLAASQEPPSIALTWVLERLARTEGLAEAFLAAPSSGAFREAVIDEVLRLRPPALASLRRMTADTDVAGYELLAGTLVMVPIPLMHRDPSRFPDPKAFRPDRFLDGSRPAEFMPFGARARSCPGESLARMELQTVVPSVLERLELRFLGRPERPVQRATVLVPRRSGLALARRCTA